MLHFNLSNFNKNKTLFPLIHLAQRMKVLLLGTYLIFCFAFCFSTTSYAQPTSKLVSGYQNMPAGLPKPSPKTNEMLQAITVLREPINEHDLSIHFHALPQAQFAGFIVALEKGFYAEAGVPKMTLKWPDAKDSPDSFDVNLNSTNPFCVQSLPSALNAKQKGEDIVSIAQFFQRSDYSIVAMSSSGIKSLKDLDNKHLQAATGNAQLFLNLFLKEFEINPKTVQPSSPTPTLLLLGAVDASMLQHYNGYHLLLQRSISPDDLVVFRLHEYGLSIPGDALHTSIEYISNNPVVCQAVVEATIKGWYYAFTHPDETLDIIMDYAKKHVVSTNRSHQAWMLNEIYQIYTYNVGPDPRNWGGLNEKDYKFAMDSLFNTDDYSRPEMSLYYSPPDRTWAISPTNSPQDKTSLSKNTQQLPFFNLAKQKQPLLQSLQSKHAPLLAGELK